MSLPLVKHGAGSGEISKATRWLHGEVSRGHSTYGKRVEEIP